MSTWWGSINRSQFILRGTWWHISVWIRIKSNWSTRWIINKFQLRFFCESLFEAETIDDTSDQTSVGFIPRAPRRVWWCNTEIYSPGVLLHRCWTTGTSASPEIKSIIINTADQLMTGALSVTPAAETLKPDSRIHFCSAPTLNAALIDDLLIDQVFKNEEVFSFYGAFLKKKV